MLFLNVAHRVTYCFHQEEQIKNMIRTKKFVIDQNKLIMVNIYLAELNRITLNEGTLDILYGIH